ncbi:MAG: tRNA (N(6)-L-threonylcarbamoyladenosine(37)-C(2))-methylthiotransferase MtaB [Bacteroidota bacterium]
MAESRTIAFHTLGCKLNFAETSSIGKQFRDAGYGKVSMEDKPDVFLLNTCSVTENADRECRTVVNRALSVNPDAIVVVTGCFAQLKPETIASIPGVDLVLGASEKFNAPRYVDQIRNKGIATVHSCDIETVAGFVSSWSSGDRTRVFLKVQDGCDYNCSFCTIPLARGASRSNSISGVLNEISKIVDSGAKEIVLTGINLGDFGIDEQGKRVETLFGLLSAIEELAPPVRIRLSSVEPNLLEDRIISLVASSRIFMPHFHLPLQSGSDAVLRRMRRRYLSGLYSDRVNAIKTLMPHASIGMDVIVGFPGETDDEFMQTMDFIRETDVTYLHVFTYSERNNTLAATMESAVAPATRKERNRMLRILSEKKNRAFSENNAGRWLDVLFESENKDGNIHGYTPNYIRVSAPFSSELINKVVRCRISGPDADGNVTALEGHEQNTNTITLFS